MKKLRKLICAIVVIALFLNISATALSINDLYDVHSNHWAYSSICYVVNKGYMGETNDHCFEPDATASRAMIVTTIYRMAGEPTINVTEAPFPDVPLNMWYTKPIAWAKSIEIIEGHSDGNFRPNNNMPREQIALIMYRYAEYLGLNLDISGANVGEFPDFYETPLGCQTAMKWAIKKGMFIGENGFLYPNNSATRAELATCLHRFEVNDSPVTGISISASSKNVSTTWAGFIQATVYPYNAGNKAVFWSSSNPQVARVDRNTGWITALEAGTTSIIATTADGNFSRTCSLTVTRHVFNMEIYQSPRRPGLMADGTKAVDMLVGDKDKSELRNMNLVLLDLANLYDQPSSSSTVLPPQGPEAVFKKMQQLADIFCLTDRNMKTVAQDMINHFIEGSGSDYQNDTLTEKAYGHSSTQNFMKSVKTCIINAIKEQNGCLSAVKNNQTFKNNIAGIPSPTFTENGDYTNGLMITVHGVWGYTIEISNYEFDGTSFSGTINFIFYDHFGLDDEDITTDLPLLGYTQQFGAWYVLQHYTDCEEQHKPFVTYMEMSMEFDGVIS